PASLRGQRSAVDLRLAANDPEQAVITVPVTVTVTGGVSTEDGAAPAALALRPNYPNPFFGTTSVTFDLPAHEHVALAVYDLTGRRVAVLVDGPVAAGTHRVEWDAGGRRAGTYPLRLPAGGTVQTRRARVLK